MAHSALIGAALIGALLSGYLLYVEQMLKRDSRYKSMCDLGDRISCTKVALSRYAYMLKVSNALIGLGFYIIVVILAYMDMVLLISYLAAIAVAVSIYLGYLSFFRMKNLCIVCMTTYLMNILILVLSLYGN